MYRIQRSVNKLIQKLPYVHRLGVPTNSLTLRGLQPLRSGPHMGEAL